MPIDFRTRAGERPSARAVLAAAAVASVYDRLDAPFLPFLHGTVILSTFVPGTPALGHPNYVVEVDG